MDKVAIVAYSQIPNTKESPEARERMYYNLATDIFTKARISHDDIGTYIFSSNDFMDGRTISECYLVQRIGAHMKDESKVEADGLYAVLYAWMRLLSGQYETALVLSVSLAGSQFRPHLVLNHVLDPVYERPRGLVNFISGAALQARAYMAKNRLTEEHLAQYVVKNLENARANPNALKGNGVPTVKEILGSKPLYAPLRELHAAPFTDGGAAVLLATEDRAKELTDTPVWIEGFGHSSDTYYIGDRDIMKLTGLRDAAKRAYKMAGIKNPAKEVCLAEVLTHYASEEPIIAEALGLFSDGSGARVIASGQSKRGGKLPVNPSGGPLGAHPLNTTGLVRLVETVSQLRGEAGPLQVKEAETALVHAQEGVCAQHNVVGILST